MGTSLRSENADGHRYYVHPVTGESLVSVTTIIEDTQAKPWLAPWWAGLSAKWCAENADRAAELGPEEFIRLAKKAAKAASEIAADAGSYAHDVVQANILGWADPVNAGDIDLPTLPDHLGEALISGIPAQEFADIVIAGFHRFVKDHSPRFEASEMTIFNRALKYAGTLDITAWLQLTGSSCDLDCLDVKTGKNVGRSVHEQLAPYRRATEALMPMGEVVPMPKTRAGLVIWLRPEFADGYRLVRVSDADDAAGWNRFRRALMLFQERAEAPDKPGQVLYPPLPDGSQPPMRLCDVEGYGPATGRLIAAGLRDVAEVARLTEAEVLDIRNVGVASLAATIRLLADHGLTLAASDVEGAA